MKRMLLAGLVLLLPVPALAEAPVAICLGDRSEWAPFTYWQRVDGKPDRSLLTGAATRLVLEALALSGLEHEIRYMPWARVLLELDQYGETGRCELTWDASYKPERAEKFHYSEPLYRTSLGVFYSTKYFMNPPAIQQAADIQAYELCGVIGYNYEEFGIGDEDIRRVQSVQQVLKMLSLGRCELFPSAVEPVYGGVALGAYAIENDVQSLRLPGLQKTFYAVVARSSPRAEKLLSQLNQQIIRLQTSGQAEAYFRKYLPNGSGLF